jgi:dTDP-4-amino-4,6-dideoxygalactose transaminase
LAANYHRLFTQHGLVEQGRLYPEHGVVLPQAKPDAQHVWHQYVIKVRRRDALRQFLTERKIGCEIYYPIPLQLQDPLKDLGYKPGDLPESERAAAEVLALPIFPELQEEEQEIVVSAIKDFLSN